MSNWMGAGGKGGGSEKCQISHSCVVGRWINCSKHLCDVNPASTCSVMLFWFSFCGDIPGYVKFCDDNLCDDIQISLWWYCGDVVIQPPFLYLQLVFVYYCQMASGKKAVRKMLLKLTIEANKGPSNNFVTL